MRLFLTVALLGALGFSAYGLLATLEPLEGGTQVRWRIAYGALAALVAFVLARLWWPAGGGSAAREGRAVGEGHGGSGALRTAHKGAVFCLATLILVLWPFAWILRDGLGPDAVESHGFDAAIRAFWTFHVGPLTLAVATAACALRWRLRAPRPA